MSDELKHNPAEGLFTIEHQGRQALLKYRRVSDNVLDYYSTFVPPESRGQGVAEKLTQGALDYAMENGFYVIPSCWYVAKFIDRHGKYKSLIEF